MNELSELKVINSQIITKKNEVEKVGELFIPESIKLSKSGIIPVLEVVAFDPNIQNGEEVIDGVTVSKKIHTDLEVGCFIVIQDGAMLSPFRYPLTNKEYYH